VLIGRVELRAKLRILSDSPVVLIFLSLIDQREAARTEGDHFFA
jgi:hypothetical protein